MPFKAIPGPVRKGAALVLTVDAEVPVRAYGQTVRRHGEVCINIRAFSDTLDGDGKMIGVGHVSPRCGSPGVRPGEDGGRKAWVISV